MKHLLAVTVLICAIVAATAFESKRCLMCKKACKEGYVEDEFGCPAKSCKCRDPSPKKCKKVKCDRKCGTQWARDQNNCQTCKCRHWGAEKLQ